jgi:prepilin-type N-terminal cleavage/methylation domain-containing protein
MARVPKIVNDRVRTNGPVRKVTHKVTHMEQMTRKRRRGDAGFTLIDMLFVVALIGLLASLAIPGLMKARGAAQSSSAIGTLRVVNSGELSFAITCGLGFYSPDLPTLGVPPAGSAEGFLPDEMIKAATFTKSGYNFSLAGTGLAGAPASCNGLGAGMASPGYAVVGDPLDPSVAKFFGSNSDGVIYQHSASLTLTMPETGGPPAGSPIQ